MAVRKASRAKPRARTRGNESDLVKPTRERKSHGTVELLERIADDEGRISRPYRAIDLLTRLERRGMISAEMRLAGYDFHQQFNLAGLEALRASDVARVIVSGRPLGDASASAYAARQAVWNALMLCGGITSVAGSCLWNVVGLEWTVERWATEQRNQARQINRHQAIGILVGVLGPLAQHYGY